MSENRNVAVESCTKTSSRQANAHGDNNRVPMFEGGERRVVLDGWVDGSWLLEDGWAEGQGRF